MASKPGRPSTAGTFKPGPDPRRNHNGQINKPLAQFRRALRDLIAEEGNKKHTITDSATGEQITLTKIEWVVIAAYNAAVTGDAKAREWISERVEGKIQEQFKHEGGITLHVVYDNGTNGSSEDAA